MGCCIRIIFGLYDNIHAGIKNEDANVPFQARKKGRAGTDGKEEGCFYIWAGIRLLL